MPEPARKGPQGKIVAIVDNFPQGPFLTPTPVRSLDEMGEIFGHEAMEWSCTMGVRMFFANGGTDAVVTRSGGPGVSTASELVVGISMLAMTQQHWDFLCLTTLSRLDDVDFNVVARHATFLSDRLGRGVEIFDPRNILVDAER